MDSVEVLSARVGAAGGLEVFSLNSFNGCI